MGLLGSLIRSGVQAGAGAYRGLNAGQALQDERAQKALEVARQARLDALAKAVGESQIRANDYRGTPQNVILPSNSEMRTPGGTLLARNDKVDTTTTPEAITTMLGPDGKPGVFRVPRGGPPERLGGAIAKPPPMPGYVIKETPEGYVYVPTRPDGGSPTPVSAPGGGQLQPNVSTALAESFRANEQSLATIDEAINKLTAHPDAVGNLTEHLPAFAQGLLDPQGQAVRNPISDAGSLEIKSRSGAAVSSGEMKRLGFIPDIRDPAPVVLDKLKRMRIFVAQQNQGMLSQYPGLRGVGSDQPSAPNAGHALTAEEKAFLRQQGHSEAEINALDGTP